MKHKTVEKRQNSTKSFNGSCANIITISREFGSGGRELGRLLAGHLGWAYYDQEIITEVAQRTLLAEKYVSSIIEQKPIPAFPIHTGTSLSTLEETELHQHNTVLLEHEKLLRELAVKANCVIVGRCADYILSEYKPFRVFVYANTEVKINRCRFNMRQGEDLSDEELEMKMRQIDVNRAAYYKFFTGREWGQKEHYDICVNSSCAELKDIAVFIANFVKTR